MTTAAVNEHESRQNARGPSRTRETGHRGGDVAFQLTKKDCLRCQIVTLNGKRGQHIKIVCTFIVLIDPYSDAVTSEVLAKKMSEVSVNLVCKNRGTPTSTELAKFNRQYKNLVVDYSDEFRGRFFIIDNVELYNLGSSNNCLGRRVTTDATRDPREIKHVLGVWNRTGSR